MLYTADVYIYIYIYIYTYTYIYVYIYQAIAQLNEALRSKLEGREFSNRKGRLEFFFGLITPAALWHLGRRACNRNEYQGFLLGAKAAGAYG